MNNIAEAMNQARHFQKKGDLKRTEDLCRGVLRAAPGNVDALFLLGVTCHQLDRVQEAIAFYEQTIQANPAVPEAHHNLGFALAQRGESGKAEACYLEALRLKPDYAGAYLNFGGFLRKQKRLEDAIRCYQQGIRSCPDRAALCFNLGTVLLDMGKTDEAVGALHEAIQHNANHAEAHNSLAIALQSQRKFDKAFESCQAALRLKPDFAEAHNTLANVLRGQGKLNEAMACYEKAIELQPSYPEAHYNLAVARALEGNLEEAALLYRKAVGFRPHFPEALNNLGTVLQQLKRFDDARICYQQLLRLNPRSAQAYLNLGVVLAEQKKIAEAISCYHQALQMNPDCAEAYCNLGQIHQEQNKIDEALACFEKALQLNPRLAEVHFNCGNAYWEKGQQEQAAACYRRATDLKPSYAVAHNNLAYILIEQGDFEEARARAQEALRFKPHYAHAFYTLSELAAHGKYHFSETEVEKMKLLVQDQNLAEADASLLHFALASVLNKRNNYDDAFKHYQQANALKRVLIHRDGTAFHAQAHSEWIGQLIDTFTPDFFEGVRGFGLESELPIFIVGMPRSGTTLVEQILSSHPDVFGAGELREIGDIATIKVPSRLQTSELYPRCLAKLNCQDAQKLAEGYLQLLRDRAHGAAHATDKMPTNFLHLGFINMLFPRARILHCQRDPRDVCVSCFFQNFRSLNFTWDLTDLGSYYRQYERLMTHWRQVISQPMLDVVYEELVDAPEMMIRKILEFCGLSWNDACLSFYDNRRTVQTMSKLQVRRPLYRSSVGRWTRYAAHLQPLLDALAYQKVEQPQPANVS